MPMDWLNTPVDVPISELIARKKRARMIEILRGQLEGRLGPGVQMRLQLADLLVQAGRGEEAVPVLIGLADEFAADGFVAKAIAILKRVEKVHQGRDDVASRLAVLVQQQQRASESVDKRGRRTVELGMEELDAGALALEEGDEELTAAEAADEPVPPPAPAQAAAEGVGQRIRGAFKRFLAGLPEAPASSETRPVPIISMPAAPTPPEPVAAEPAPAEPPPPPVIETPPAAPATPEVSDDTDPLIVGALSAQVPDPEPVADEPPADDLEITLEPDEEPPPAELSAEAYEERLLDIVQDVLQRPTPEPAAGVDRPRLVAYADRLLAMPLFSDLSEEELLAVVRGLRVHLFAAGDVIVTEREPGQSLFILTGGRVKVFVRNPAGRNYLVAQLRNGDFFGEIATLSGRPRTATVVAAAVTDVLELDKEALDGIARSHPRVCEVLEDAYIRRASSPEVAAIRSIPFTDASSGQRAIEVLEAHFGESRWDPRMRLRLADVLVRAGKEADAVPILVGLADDLARGGFPEKAISILKKIEQLQRRHVEEVPLAPRLHAEPLPEEAVTAPVLESPSRRSRARTDDFLHAWLLDTVRGAVRTTRPAGQPAPPPRVLRGYGPGFRASPLFEGFAEDELLALIQELRLLTFAPGDVVVTEGEPGQSLFILATGKVKVFVRSATGHDVAVGALGEGAFFGEMATLSGQPRSATVTAAAPCDLLELDRPALERIAVRHPNMRAVLEDFSRRRAADPAAAAARTRRPD
jgi:CRP-like cAMP-binding protein